MSKAPRCLYSFSLKAQLLELCFSFLFLYPSFFSIAFLSVNSQAKDKVYNEKVFHLPMQ